MGGVKNPSRLRQRPQRRPPAAEDALDSVAGQSFPLFECIVANDTGEPLDVAAMGHPWVRVVDTKGRTGPAIARNTAIAAAKAPLIAILDADDMFYPDWLKVAYKAYLENPECLVYADCDTEEKIGDRERYNCREFSVERIMGTGRRDANHYPQAIYQSAILYPQQWWNTPRTSLTECMRTGFLA